MRAYMRKLHKKRCVRQIKKKHPQHKPRSSQDSFHQERNLPTRYIRHMKKMSYVNDVRGIIEDIQRKYI